MATRQLMLNMLRIRHLNALITRRHASSAQCDPMPYMPRRCVMYVPGSDEKKIAKIASMPQLDCVVLDHEDGVAESAKDTARRNIHQALMSSLPFPAERVESGADLAVRVNSPQHSDLADEDLRSCLQAATLPTSLFVPKIESRDEVDWLADKISKYLDNRQSAAALPPLRLVLYMESAEALLNLEKTSRQAALLGEKSSDVFRFDGIVFGSDDFLADIGAQRTKDAHECLYARQKVVVIAKAFRVQAIDLVHIDYKDEIGLRRAAEEGRQLGFSGKQVIHPAQIAIVQEAFSPSSEQLEWARELVRAFEQHGDEGRGAFTFRDRMIDRPLLLQARNVLRVEETLRQRR